MSFRTDSQRKKFFALYGGGYSGGSKEHKPGRDPVHSLVKQDKRAIKRAIKIGNKQINDDEVEFNKVQEEKRKLKLTGDSQSKYKVDNHYTPERLQVHTRLIEKVNNQKAYPNNGDKPKVIFIGGLSGSGKSSAIAKLIDRDPNEKEDYKAYPDFIYLNSDDFKTWLPEYNGYNAGYLHEESTDIFEEAVKLYKDQRKQIIIDATLKNSKSANKKIQDFKQAGYETILYGTNIKGEKAIERATARFKRSKRYVPLEMVGGNAEKTNKSVLKLRHKTDDYAVFNTDVKLGEKPKLIESKDSLEIDRKQTAKEIVNTEKEWREKGVNVVDLKGYDTKEHKKTMVRIR